MIKPLRERINDIISESRYFSPEQLHQALNIQKARGGELSRILIEQGLITEKELITLLSEELRIPSINLAKFKIAAELADIIPERVARKYRLVPISKIGNILTVAMADPLNIVALDDLKILTKCEIDGVLAGDEEMNSAMDRYYPSEQIEWDEMLES